MFTVLRASHPVRVLYIARGISEIGNWCANIALPMLIYEVTHDVSATALMVCCRFAPSLFSVSLAQLPQKMGIGTLQAMRLTEFARDYSFAIFLLIVNGVCLLLRARYRFAERLKCPAFTRC